MSTPRAARRPPRRERRGLPPLASDQRRAMVRNRLIESRLTPNAISLTGLALNVLAAVLVWQRLFFVGGLAFIIGSIMDTLDGRYSRMSGKGSPFGAFLDSTLDRVGDAAIFTALLWWFVGRGNQVWLAAATAVCLIGGAVVSYAKARAEGLGLTAEVGIAERSERLVTVLVSTGLTGLFHAPWIQATGLTVLAVATVVTVAQRMAAVHRQVAQADGAGAHQEPSS